MADYSSDNYASDIEIAAMLAYHIDNPCREPKTGHDIRYIYLGLAKMAVKEFENPYAIQLLEQKIRQYSNEL